MTDTGQADGSSQPDAHERMKTLSEDKRRLLEAMMRQRSAEGTTPSLSAGASSPRSDGRLQPEAGSRRRATPKPRSQTAPDPATSLVAIKAAGGKPPFFCVHGILGSAFPFFRLAALIDPEQPFYGLQAPGLDGATAPLQTIEEMARHYIDLVRGVRPRGPYHLGGYSFGGWVAFEMAQQLVAAGETVELLVMLGTGAPLSTANPRLFEQVNFLARYSEDYHRLVTNSMLPDGARGAPPPGFPFPGFPYPGMQPSGFPSSNAPASVPPPPGPPHDGSSAPSLSPVAAVAAANNVAQYRYMPRPYVGRVTLFVTGEQHAAAFPETTLGWKMLSVRDVPVHLVSGNHLSMFEEPHVRDLADKLMACLDLHLKG